MGNHQEWAQHCCGSTAVSRVAELALESRIADVDRHVSRVVDGGRDVVESVHQLRVSARRANAALSLFSETLPKSVRRKWNRRLRHLRKSAGRTRDLDVMRLRVKLAPQADSRGAWRRVHREISHQRLDAQQELVAGCIRWQRFERKQRSRILWQQVQWRSKETEPAFRNFAAESLGGVFRQFSDEAGATDVLIGKRRAGKGSVSSKVLRHLHQMRIAGKRAKYMMELFEPACGSTLRDGVAPILTQIQDHLGAINDHAVAIQRYRRIRKGSDRQELRRALKKVIRWEEQSLVESVENFQSWWSPQRTLMIESYLEKGINSDASH